MNRKSRKINRTIKNSFLFVFVSILLLILPARVAIRPELYSARLREQLRRNDPAPH